MSLAKEFVIYAKEDFLTTLANKGIYKRAIKDCELVKEWRFEETGEILIVDIDDITVKLYKNVSLSLCSCPSKTVCKHVLMAVLKVAETAEVENKEPSVQENAYLELHNASLEDLKKNVGKRLFDEGVNLVLNGFGAEFTEGEMLSAQIVSENITIYFPKTQSLTNAICKCGSTELCRHKLIAVLSYLNQKTILKQGDESIQLLNQDSLELVRSMLSFITDIFEKGVICCGEHDMESAIQFSLRMDSNGMKNLSRLLRRLSSDIEKMIIKHVDFNSNMVFALLSRLYNGGSLILKHAKDPEKIAMLVEGGRSEYLNMPMGTFTGLGAYPWQTRSGYAGITILIYYHERQQICTYTASMPDYYEKTSNAGNIYELGRQLVRREHWQGDFSLECISTSCFTLRNFKINRQNRLSSSKQTQCKISNETKLDIVGDFIFSKIEENKSVAYEYFQKQKAEEVYIVSSHKIVETYFDKVQQILYFVSESCDGERTKGFFPFDSLHENAIQYMEMQVKHYPRDRCFICLKRREGLVPVSILDHTGIQNFYF